MASLRVIKYTASLQSSWNTFVQTAKNDSFLFQRNFMDYHQDRFADFSLLIYEKNTLVAVLPANRKRNCVYSHQGLTYGGLILSKTLKFKKVTAVFQAILQFLEAKNITELQLTPIPEIYHTYPAQEINYLLFLVKAQRTCSRLSTTLLQTNRPKIQVNRIEGVKKAHKQHLSIEKGDFSTFWNAILIPNLQQRYQAKPVHSEEEILQLHARFPQNIHQYNVYKKGKIVGGATLFETSKVIHTQYISADKNRQQLGTLDFLFNFLIEDEFAHKKYFDFGTSNLPHTHKIHDSLLYWKESFGGRSTVLETYRIMTKNHVFLTDIFV